MYLISIYFDKNTEKILQRLIDKVAINSGNRYMIEAKVPPHITISAFETNEEDKIVELLDKNIHHIGCGTLNWVSIGVFNPHVIFLSTVLNEYLHKLSVFVHENISSIPKVSISRFYLPFQWIPHTTIAKKLLDEEMTLAFETLQNNFCVFSGRVTRIGLSKTNPYREISIWDLEKKI